jgi:type VI secretion system protein ImpJ
MVQFRKVIWHEGMFVTPHHFQQSDVYHEGIVHYKFKNIFPFSWGVIKGELDHDALANGSIAVRHLKLIMFDGTVVSVPDLDSAPDNRSFKNYFPPDKKTIDFYVGLPVEKDDIPNCLDRDNTDGSEHHQARYTKDEIDVPDLITGKSEDKRKISIGQKNIKTLFSGENLDNFTVIKMGEIARTATGEFYLNEKYIPPCLHLSASGHLLDILRGLIEALSAKNEALSAQRAHRSSGAAKFGIAEATHFWLLHTVNSYIPLLLHCYNNQSFHPEKLYTVLAQLTGALTTFAFEEESQMSNPTEIVLYKHEDLGNVFEKLDRRIRNLLEVVIPTKWVQVPLTREKDTLWVGRLESFHLEETAHFYLKAEGELQEKVIREDLPEKIKVADKSTIDTIVNRALSGIPISYAPMPAESIPLKPGDHYFKVDHNHRRWKAIKSSRTIAIYVPIEFKDLKLELIAVKE